MRQLKARNEHESEEKWNLISFHGLKDMMMEETSSEEMQMDTLRYCQRYFYGERMVRGRAESIRITFRMIYALLAAFRHPTRRRMSR